MDVERNIVPSDKKFPEEFTLQEAIQILTDKGCKIETSHPDGDDFVQYSFAWPGQNRTKPFSTIFIHLIGYKVYSGEKVPPIDNIIEGEVTSVDGKPLLNSGK